VRARRPSLPYATASAAVSAAVSLRVDATRTNGVDAGPVTGMVGRGCRVSSTDRASFCTRARAASWRSWRSFYRSDENGWDATSRRRGLISGRTFFWAIGEAAVAERSRRTKGLGGNRRPEEQGIKT
jgi:hypothetical protein